MSTDQQNNVEVSSVSADATEQPTQLDPAIDPVQVNPEPVSEPQPVVEEKKHNAEQQFEIFEPLPEAWVKNPEAIEELAIIPESIEVINERVQSVPNLDIGNSAEIANWNRTLQDSLETAMPGNSFQATLERKESFFVQKPEHEGHPLMAGTPRFDVSAGEKVSGERAVMRVRSLLGMGTMLQIPLWHSGFWITIKAPGEGALLELQRRLIEEKINLGRTSRGLVFSNTSVYMSRWLTDFVLEHTYDSTIKDPNPNYRTLIRSLDIPTIIWGLACTVWPNGFKYTRACITDPTKCQHVVSEKINLSKLLWVDRNSLTPWQLAHMSSRAGSSMSLESIQRYIVEFTRGRSRMVKMGDNNISVEFKVPNLDEYIKAGIHWVDDIVQMIDSSLSNNNDQSARNFNITQLGKATTLRQYSHWVQSIDAHGVTIEDRESIENSLNDMSTDSDVRKLYLEGVKKYIDDATIAVVAVPSYECPKCTNLQKSNLPRFPHLLPIDTMSSFFTLLVPRLQKIHVR